MSTPNRESLRPIERRVLDLHEEGLLIDDIAARFNRSPGSVERILVWTDIPRNGESEDRHLRPIERRVLDMRADGESHAEIAEKFRKTERFIRQVEGLAHFKEGLRILSEG
ncbi:MAG TPA: hypothetical protein VFS66_00010 [Acidimicrobiia bacterium]|nr:hypothetical protein [Acidimicrobiia bacterium]